MFYTIISTYGFYVHASTKTILMVATISETGHLEGKGAVISKWIAVSTTPPNKK